MKQILTTLSIIICQQLAAQDVWFESRYSSYYNYNSKTDLYELSVSEWNNTRFAPTREYILIEFTPNDATKILWAQASGNDSNCYYTEQDIFKICFNYDANYVNIYSNEDTTLHRYTEVWQLSKISELN